MLYSGLFWYDKTNHLLGWLIFSGKERIGWDKQNQREDALFEELGRNRKRRRRKILTTVIAILLVAALVLVVAAMYFLRKYENTLWLRGALQGLRPAAFGLVVSAAWIFLVLAATSGTWGTADFSIRLLPGIMAVAVLILQLRTKIPFLWLMVICGILGAFFCR